MIMVEDIDDEEEKEDKASSVNDEEEDDAPVEHEENYLIRQKIKKIASQKKIRISIVMSVITTLLSAYFVGVYLMSSNAFNRLVDSINDLSTIYSRDACLSELLANVRSEFKANIDEGPIDPIEILRQCRSLENDFTDLKKEVGPYFKDVEELLFNLDSELFCSELN